MEFPQFTGGSYQDQFAAVACEETINLYLEQVQSGNSKNKSGYAMKRSPGLTSRWSTGAALPVSGLFGLNGHVFGLIGTTINDFSYNGSALTLSGSINGVASDGTRPQFAANPNSIQLGIYSAANLYSLQSASLVPVNWMGVPPAGLDLLNSFFVILSSLGDGFFYSNPGDITSGSPLNFVKANASANAFVSLVVDHEQVWLFGDGNVSQVFYNSTNGTSPFLPNLSAVIPQGTIAAASPISMNNTVWWLGNDGAAYSANGYLPTPVSTKAIENQWRTYPTMSDAVSTQVTFNGHHMWRIYFPSADRTWEYDTDLGPQQGWHKVLGWNAGTGQYTAHRGFSATTLTNAGQKLTQFVGDRSNGKIYSLEPDSGWDDTVRMVWDRVTPVIFNENKNINFPWFELDMQTGVGDGGNLNPLAGPVTPESDPYLSIFYSDDYGQHWSNELLRSMGRKGETKKRVFVSRCGEARQRAWRVTGSAAVPTAFNTAYLGDPEALNS